MKWLAIFKQKETVKFEDMRATNFRIPKELRRLIDEDLFMMKYEEDDYTSFNEFLILLMAEGGNYEYVNDTWKRKKDGNTLYDFYQQKRERA